MLAGEPDWPRLVFAGGGIGSLGAPAQPATSPLIEPPVSELLADAKLVDDHFAARAPAAPPGPAGPGPTGPGAGATARARCTMKPRRVGRRGRLKLSVRCDRAATVRLSGRLTFRRRHVRLKTAGRRVKGGTRVVMTLQLPKAARRTLARHRRIKAVFTLRATNAGGTRVTRRKVARLR